MKFVKAILLSIVIFVSLLSCNKIKKATKETINKGGETVDKSATEFIEGVGEGIDQTLALQIQISDELVEKGLSTGKYDVHTSENGNNNKLTLYLIFEDNFNETIFIKIMDKNGLEVGRTTMLIESTIGEASYFDFEFDPRTNLESKGIIIIE